MMRSTAPIGDLLRRPRRTLGAADGVARHDQTPRLGEKLRRLLGDALDAGTDGREAVLRVAGGTDLGGRLDIAAVVALQQAALAVLHQPGRAGAAGEAVAAMPAKRQRRVAAAIEKQHGLLAPGERLGNGVDERRRQEAATLGRFEAQIDGFHARQRRAAVAGGEGQPPVAALLGIGHGFQAGRGRDQDDRRRLQPGAYHGHVAGVVDHALLLLEGRFMFLVDDDEAETRERQKERGAGPDDDRRLSVRDGAPGAAPGGRGQVGVPDGRRHAEAAGEAVKPLRRKRDFGQEDEALAAEADGRRHRFQIGFGLARAGDAVEQRDGERAGADASRQGLGGLGLLGRESGGTGVIRIGTVEGLAPGHGDRAQPAAICHRARDALADACFADKVCQSARLAVCQHLQQAAASGCHGGIRWRLARKPAGAQLLRRRRQKGAADRHG